MRKLLRKRRKFLKKGGFYRIILEGIIAGIAIFIFWRIKEINSGENIYLQTIFPKVERKIEIFSLILKISLAIIFAFWARIRYSSFKRLFDFSFATIGLILASPLFIIIAFLIKLDSKGSIFFKQQRVGRNGKIFNMWKFRTMREYAELESGPVWAKDDDPRVTRVGRFLRKSHLDELPQLINVFKGDMSLIGPRPERYMFIEMIHRHIPEYKERLKVKPGITGLAQVRYKYGASVKDAAKKLKYDLLYIKKMCWLLDFQILWWTAEKIFTGEGAR